MQSNPKQRAFYYALYACLGIVLIGTIVTAVYLTAPNSSNDVVPTMGATLGTGEIIPPPSINNPMVTTPVQGQPPQDVAIREFFNIGEQAEEPQEVYQYYTEDETQQLETPQEVEEFQETQEVQVYEPQEVIPVFSPFTEGSTMIWPTLGEIVMDYSSNAFVFDNTLNLYRTNDVINIAAPQGSVVRASAEGLVIDISYERREGTMLTIDHGNGWATTYTQLGDIVVSLGDVVAAGQIVGEVGSPSIFTSALGDNLGFRVTHYDSTINPLNVLP